MRHIATIKFYNKQDIEKHYNIKQGRDFKKLRKFKPFVRIRDCSHSSLADITICDTEYSEHWRDLWFPITKEKFEKTLDVMQETSEKLKRKEEVTILNNEKITPVEIRNTGGLLFAVVFVIFTILLSTAGLV